MKAPSKSDSPTTIVLQDETKLLKEVWKLRNIKRRAYSDLVGKLKRSAQYSTPPQESAIYVTVRETFDTRAIIRE